MVAFSGLVAAGVHERLLWLDPAPLPKNDTKYEVSRCAEEMVGYVATSEHDTTMKAWLIAVAAEYERLARLTAQHSNKNGETK